LLKAHQTRQGTRRKIHVTQGQLHYRILEPEYEEVLLSAEKAGIVEPTIPHEVEPNGDVRFYVEFFLNRPKRSASQKTSGKNMVAKYHRNILAAPCTTSATHLEN